VDQSHKDWRTGRFMNMVHQFGSKNWHDPPC
jgi:hypothetical protein